LGALAGEPQVGFMLGALLELFLVGELPVGGALPLNGPVVASTAVLSATGVSPLNPAWSLPAALAAGWTFRPLEARMRQARASFVSRFERKLHEEGRPNWAGLIFASVCLEFVIVLGFLAAAVAAAKLLGGWWWGWTPSREGSEFAWKAAPPLAVVGAVYALKPQ
jgi:mannose/fructose/N-acetylgalactosamine-specific phosphotransferase system component IIC